jgi:hypothetical protein
MEMLVEADGALSPVAVNEGQAAVLVATTEEASSALVRGAGTDLASPFRAQTSLYATEAVAALVVNDNAMPSHVADSGALEGGSYARSFVVPPQDDSAVGAREWFWRAKNAETLDDVVECLEQAHALEPSNEMIAGNLEWATERRDAQRKAAKAAKHKPTNDRSPEPPLRAHRGGPGLAIRSLALVLDLARAALAMAAFALGGIVLQSALPAVLKEELSSAIGLTSLLAQTGLPLLELPDASRLTSLVHVPLGGGYDLGLALPYALGFLAMFIGMSLLHRNIEPSRGGRY